MHAGWKVASVGGAAALVAVVAFGAPVQAKPDGGGKPPASATDLTCASTCVQDGEIESVSWLKLLDVPAGFADGVDNDTTYTAGTGLQLDAQTGELSLSTVPWSLLTGVPSDLADGDDDTTYTAGDGLQLSDGRFSSAAGSTVVLVAGDGDAAANGSRLRAAVESASGATEAAPVLIVAAPGTYQLGSDPLVLPDFVSLTGAGREITRLEATVEAYASGAVEMGYLSTVSRLTVDQRTSTTEGPAPRPAVFSRTPYARLVDVVAIAYAQGPGRSNGIVVAGDGNRLEVESAKVYAPNSTGFSYGLLAADNARLVARDTHVEATHAVRAESGGAVEFLNGSAAGQGAVLSTHAETGWVQVATSKLDGPIHDPSRIDCVGAYNYSYEPLDCDA